MSSGILIVLRLITRMFHPYAHVVIEAPISSQGCLKVDWVAVVRTLD